MPIKEFTDSNGVRWRVWPTIPEKRTAVMPEMRDGWLSFDSGRERRRFSPIPDDWENLPAQRLELLCKVAGPVRISDPAGFPTVRDEAVGEAEAK